MFLTINCRALTMIFRERFADFSLLFLFPYFMFIMTNDNTQRTDGF